MEGGGQRPVGRGQRAERARRKADGERQRAEGGGWQMVEGGRWGQGPGVGRAGIRRAKCLLPASKFAHEH